MSAGLEAALPGHIENALREIKMIGARASGNGLHGVSRERARPLRFDRLPLRARSAGFRSNLANYGLTYFFLQ
ncbi:conserved hypothetical protein [Mesorhizobium escarrei]|uniref:Uncharacterized protein n=1 Tax=Mesorhizobium escarrei TaxID=666018 RepID=A0ABN8KA14_9HYPH|nr:conserved hypothetical protein [Mesorhizobium escarrei]